MKALIDFENVSSPGLDGLKGLSKNDEFLIFYGEDANISFDLHRQIERLECKKDYQKISSEAANSLDFLLSTILGRLIAIDSISSYSIISKNDGYDVIIKYWKAKGINIGRYSSLREALGNNAAAEAPVSNNNETEKVIETIFATPEPTVTPEPAEAPETTEAPEAAETPETTSIPELNIDHLMNTRNSEN